MSRPRLVRRRSRYERFKDYVNPLDWFLWASEEFETGDWDSKAAGTTTGLALSFIFLIARANTGRSASYEDDIFSDYQSGPGWAAWLVSLPPLTALLQNLTLSGLPHRMDVKYALHSQCGVYIPPKASLPSV